VQFDACSHHREILSADECFRGNHLYVGPLLDGVPHGQGVLTFADGAEYKNDFNMGA
jgi:hypothetical protein